MLADGIVAAGTHRVVWNDEPHVASGVHFLRLTARPLDGGAVFRLQRPVVHISD